MKILFSVIFAITSLVSFAQNNAAGWYKMLNGKIDKYSVTLHLHKAGHTYSGYYYYDSKQEPIYFMGEDTSVKGKIKLIAFPPGDNSQQESLVFSCANGKATGTWKTGSKQNLIFTAIELPSSEFSYVYTTGSVKLRPKIKKSPVASYEAASVWPTGNTVKENFIKKVIRDAFIANNQSAEEIGALLLKEKRNFLNEYLRENKDIKDIELKGTSFAYNMEQDNKMMIVYGSPNILTMAYFNYSYTGGAHGNYGTSYYSLDLLNRKQLQLSDIITLDGIPVLKSLLEKSFRKQFQLKATDSLHEAGLFENVIEPNENFYLTSTGIGFNYVPYEIGPYAMGEITILFH